MITNDYRTQAKAWGVRSTPIVVQAAQLVQAAHPVALDLGAGQGRDSLYLARQGFQVAAVDKSPVGLKQLREDNPLIKTITADIAAYGFTKRYDLIIAINVLHFLPKKAIPAMIQKIQQAVAPSGLIAISVLLDSGKIQSGELKAWFKGYKIISYREFRKDDQPHLGAPEPHTHQLAQIVVRGQS